MYVNVVTRTIAAAAVIRTALQCDCNPTLYFNDVWFRSTLRNQLQTMKGRGKQHPFHNKCIWIIGASSGIGEELAYQLVSPIYPSPKDTRQRQKSQTLSRPPLQQQQNHHHPIHLILSSRSIDRLQKVATTCQSYNPHCTITLLPFDVSKDDEIYSSLQELGEMGATIRTQDDNDTVGLIDIVVFNAGIGHLSPAIETSVSTIDDIWKQTARYPMIIIPQLLKNLQQQQNNNNKNNSNNNNNASKTILKNIHQPHFVITSSIAAMIPVPLSSIYGATKAALWNYCRTLQCENPHLLLHTIMPGPVDTNFFHRQQQQQQEMKSSSSSSTGSMKMSVHRCVQLMISTMRLSYSTESWMVPSSSSTTSPFSSLLFLVGLYLNKLLPFALLHSIIYRKIGPKRILMWKNGYDLYDPKSWRTSTRQLPGGEKKRVE